MSTSHTPVTIVDTTDIDGSQANARKPLRENSGPGRDRTCDLGIMSPLL